MQQRLAADVEKEVAMLVEFAENQLPLWVQCVAGEYWLNLHHMSILFMGNAMHAVRSFGCRQILAP